MTAQDARKGQGHHGIARQSQAGGVRHFAGTRAVGRARRVHGRLAAAAAHEPEDWIADAPSQMARLCTCHEGLISELRPAESELIRRIDFGEEDRETVAADLGLTRNALGVRLHRARTALREALTAHCGSCCREDREDCSCPPRGCANVVHETDCEDVGQEH